MNGQPLGRKNTIRLIVILLILIGATQTLLHQWGYSAEVPPASNPPENPPTQLPPAPTERFVPAPIVGGRGATLELRGEATLAGAEIRLKQVCRWSNADNAAFTQVGELVIAHFDARTPFRTVSLDEIRQTLHDAGVNVAVIHFAGPTQCTVNRSDVAYNEGTALDQWIDARDKAKAPDAGAKVVAQADANASPGVGPAPHATPTDATASAAPVAEAAKDDSPIHTLKDLLLSDLSVRLSIPVTDLQVNFNPADQKVLSLSEPTFKFNISTRYIRNLGDVQWDVLVVTDAGTKKASIAAMARAWQKQVVVLRPLDEHQILQATDISERRILIDRTSDEPLLTAAQVIGQQSARAMKPGQVLTAHMVDAVPLVKAGQFVTVNLQQGGIRVKTVVRATEGGSYGQTIRVRDEATRDTYDVTLTGPQEGVLGPLASDASSAAGGAKVASVSGN